MGTNGPWDWRLIVPKITGDVGQASFKTTVRDDCVLSTCTMHPSTHTQLCLWKLSPPACHEDGLGPWTDVRHLPPTWLASEIKQTFLSTNLACLLAFEWRAARHWCTFLVTLDHKYVSWAPKAHVSRFKASRNRWASLSSPPSNPGIGSDWKLLDACSCRNQSIDHCHQGIWHFDYSVPCQPSPPATDWTQSRRWLHRGKLWGGCHCLTNKANGCWGRKPHVFRLPVSILFSCHNRKAKNGFEDRCMVLSHNKQI